MLSLRIPELFCFWHNHDRVIRAKVCLAWSQTPMDSNPLGPHESQRGGYSPKVT